MLQILFSLMAAASELSAAPNAGQAPVTEPSAQAPVKAAEHPLLMDKERTFSLGWRFWVNGVPASIVRLFAYTDPAWGGMVNVATGPELVIRRDNLDIAVAAMYAGYQAPAGFFRGSREPPEDTERWESTLYAFFLTTHFLWGIRVNKMFEIQLGLGLGLGYLSGNLYRSQAYPTNAQQTTWEDCVSPTGGPPEYCANNPNDHYTQNKATEPSMFKGGAIPTIMPWISIPHFGFHFRPHKNVDIRADVGWALISFYGGLSVHYVFAR